MSQSFERGPRHSPGGGWSNLSGGGGGVRAGSWYNHANVPASLAYLVRVVNDGVDRFEAHQIDEQGLDRQKPWDRALVAVERLGAFLVGLNQTLIQVGLAEFDPDGARLSEQGALLAHYEGANPVLARIRELLNDTAEQLEAARADRTDPAARPREEHITKRIASISQRSTLASATIVGVKADVTTVNPQSGQPEVAKIPNFPPGNSRFVAAIHDPPGFQKDGRDMAGSFLSACLRDFELVKSHVIRARLLGEMIRLMCNDAPDGRTSCVSYGGGSLGYEFRFLAEEGAEKAFKRGVRLDITYVDVFDYEVNFSAENAHHFATQYNALGGDEIAVIGVTSHTIPGVSRGMLRLFRGYGTPGELPPHFTWFAGGDMILETDRPTFVFATGNGDHLDNAKMAVETLMLCDATLPGHPFGYAFIKRGDTPVMAERIGQEVRMLSQLWGWPSKLAIRDESDYLAILRTAEAVRAAHVDQYRKSSRGEADAANNRLNFKFDGTFERVTTAEAAYASLKQGRAVILDAGPAMEWVFVPKVGEPVPPAA